MTDALVRSSAGQTPSAQRITWMDTTRGLAILAVISFHTASEIHGRGIVVPDAVLYLNAVFAPIRIPLLIFLSGLLLPMAVEKGEHRYFSGKVRAILYPYLVWATINTVVVAQLTGQSHLPKRIEVAIMSSPGYAWFLALLLTFYIMAWPLRSVPRIAVISISVVAMLCLPPGSPGLTNPAAFLVGFFFLGWWCGENGESFRRFLSSRAAMWIGLAGVAAMLVNATKLQMTFDHEPTMWPWAAVGALGMLLVLRFADRVCAAPILDPIRYVGRNSLRFYVVHFPVLMVAAWVFAERQHMTNATHLIMIIGVVVLGVCMAVSLITDRIHLLEWLFMWKAPIPSLRRAT